MTIRELKSEARQRLRELKKRPYVLTLLFVLCAEGVSGIFNLLNSLASMLTVGGIGGIAVNAILGTVMALISLAVILLQSVWGCHYSNFSVKLSRGRDVSFLDFMAPFRIFGSTLLAMLLIYLKIFMRAMLGSLVVGLLGGLLLTFISNTVIAALITLTMMLVLIISCYMVMYRYYFVFQALYDGDGCPAGIALKRSEALTNGNRFLLFKLDLSFLWYTIPLLLPSLVTVLRSADLTLLTGWSFPAQWLIPAIAGSWLISITLQILVLPYMETTRAVAYNRLLSRFVTPQEPESVLQDTILLQDGSQNQSNDEPASNSDLQ